MDDRQRKIVEGAGLEDSRYNKEFVEFLKKWGPIACILVGFVAGAYGIAKWFGIKRLEALDAAFAEHDAAANSGNPENLLSVAQEKKGYGAVWEMASLKAASIYLSAAKRGLEPGAEYDAETRSYSGEDLSEEQRSEYLKKAEDIYRAVFEALKNNENRSAQALSAHSGLVGVAITKRDFDGARKLLEEEIELAQQLGHERVEEVAQIRLDKLAELQALPEPPLAAQVATWPFAATPPTGLEFPADPTRTDTGPREFEQPVPTGEGETAPPTDPPTDPPPTDPPTTDPPQTDPPETDPPKTDPPTNR